MTSDSGPWSLTETEYKPKFFNEPEYLSSDKENVLPTESITPPSLKNLSLEEGTNSNNNEATSWEANVARNIVTTPRASSPYPRWTSTLEDLEPDTDDDIIDITDFSERPANDKRSPQPKHNFMTHTMTQGHCPTHVKTAPHIYPWMQQQQHLPNLTGQRSGESSPTRKEYSADGPHV